ncbi:hypothetical protein [Mesorhizobium sp. L-8-3]|uniref:hypothetical protein n=1 Tax=Mesorhizobium sp. L-8-3 TaxID=2744522 RepID=UPI001926847F|nr:hypothetical protein [Mesorhizobium sp. L-8-3]BCH26317.1 hypothetical protein MesoLjLb_61020 [Mesorhizobium sp. L-8-3]
MADKLIPGNLSAAGSVGFTDPRFTDSMAEEIEQELNALMTADGLPSLDLNASDTTVRDRRRLFVAIARGIVRHLENNKSAIKVYCEHDETKPVTVVDVDYG